MQVTHLCGQQSCAQTGFMGVTFRQDSSACVCVSFSVLCIVLCGSQLQHRQQRSPSTTPTFRRWFLSGHGRRLRLTPAFDIYALGGQYFLSLSPLHLRVVGFPVSGEMQRAAHRQTKRDGKMYLCICVCLCLCEAQATPLSLPISVSPGFTEVPFELQSPSPNRPVSRPSFLSRISTLGKTFFSVPSQPPGAARSCADRIRNQ